jgi:dTDP-4-amino-4,6-dideoxygalactose transaminase
LLIPVAKPYLNEDEAQAAYNTVMSGWVTQGPRVQEFEEKFAAYVGSKYAVAVSNCTTALHLAMIVSGIGPGDEVICPSLSYIATANSITYAGAKPVFAEVNEDYNLDIADVEKKITSKTKAILLVHQIGMPADIDSFKELAEKRGLKIIEDAACAIGSKYKDVRIGSHSELVCFSFHPRKVITTGDGGMIATNRSDYATRLKLLRQHGMSVNPLLRHQSNKIIFEDHLEIGYNYRMTDIQAAVGIRQLEKLDKLIEERRRIAYRYHEAFSKVSCVRIPQEKDGYFSNYQSYSLYIRPEAPLSRNELMEKLLEQGIATRRGVMTAHRETAYRIEYGNMQLPVSEDLCDRSIILPLFVPMHDDEINHVIKQVTTLLR